MGTPLWTFEGYETDTKNRPVQVWFDEELTIDERDLIRDRITKLENIDRINWRRPGFDKLDDDICEIQKSSPAGPIRIYGFFSDIRYHFVFLLGHRKKVKNDKHGKRTAVERLKLLRRGIGRVHAFDFEEKSSGISPA